MHFDCKTMAQTAVTGESIFKQLSMPSCVYLEGEMGAGKTTLCQAIIRAAGYTGVVTSPTYNLIHEYPIANGVIYHMDFYRLDDPSEAQFLGLEDLWLPNSLFLIEWPQKAEGFLRSADYVISIKLGNNSRKVNLRNVSL